MRGLETPIRVKRREVFKEVAKIAFESTSQTLIDDIESIPYKIINEETALLELKVLFFLCIISSCDYYEKRYNCCYFYSHD